MFGRDGAALFRGPFIDEGLDETVHLGVVLGRHHVQVQVRWWSSATLTVSIRRG
jgi:hypothetical protein